ncbi:carbohydrate ABC transporter permease [Patulibacter defluvii]|uniref:carbohydrate ABC transporter permease n=1 Tax=Patulibacter defluvii TaxID=3095358 RepID=UPI002A758302|nr:sugar ABC transporter permease [Patulibacter sp. DM4]
MAARPQPGAEPAPRSGRGPAAGGGAPPARGRRRARAGRRDPWPWFALPAIAFVLIFFAAPFVLNAGFAFSDWSGFSDEISFNGLDNFRALIDQDLFVNAVKVTVLYALVTLVLQTAISLPLALMLVENSRINTVFRSLFFVPVLISPLAAGYVWKGLLAPDGPINGAIAFVLPGGFDWNWLGEPSTALPAVALIDAWKWSGLITLVYIAGLKAIPKEMIEAAMLDGAGAFQRFWRIRLRLLAPAMTFNVAVTLVGALSAYDVVAATTGGGPGDHTTTLNVAMRGQWGQSFFGPASALSLTVTALVIVTAVPLVAWLRRREVA